MKIPKTKPIRSREHITYVKSMPCTIVNEEGERCNGLPVDAHHLMKIGNRGMSRKENDNWTVPLCRNHHREVTDCGDEEDFWADYGFSYDEVKDIAIEYAMDSPSEVIFEYVNSLE